MNLQIDKNLYDERYYGGFEPTDPEDETFLLEKIDNYPGTLPFEFKETETENLDFVSEPEQTPEVSPIPQQSSEITYQEGFTGEESSPFEEKIAETGEISENINKQFDKIGKEERVPIPYEKAGVEKIEKEVLPYEKAGLVEKEEVTPFVKTPTEAIQKDYPDYEPKDKPVKSIWDIFEEETPTTEETDQPAVEETTPFEEAKSEAIQEQPLEQKLEPELKQKVETTEKEPETIIIEPQSIVDVPIEIKIEGVDPEEFSKVFDEDFRKTIIEDLAKSEKRKKEKVVEDKEIITTKEKEELQKELNVASGVESKSEVMEFDLSEMSLEKPSEILAKDLVESGDLDKLKKKMKKQKIKETTEEAEPSKSHEEITEAPIDLESAIEPELTPAVVEVQTEDVTEQAEEPKTEENEEKKKRKVPVLWFIFAGLIFLILLIGGYFAYLNFIKKPVSEKEITKKETEIKKPKVQEIQQKEKNKEEFRKPEPTELQVKEEAKAPTGEQKVTLEKPQKLVAEKTSTEKISPTKEKPTKSTEKPEPSKKEKVKEFESKFSSIKKTEKIKIIEETPETKTSLMPKEEYSIEIFSTTEMDEATYWVNQLTHKGVNAYLKPYRFRNINYYKVRVGKFNSIEEAKQVARTLGFKNFWIDRIK